MERLVNSFFENGRLFRIYQFAMDLLHSRTDRLYLKDDVPLAKVAGHETYLDYLVEIGNQPGKRILEVGSREVTGASDARTRFSAAEYTGFDYYPGPNVDVVGDAHKLSTYFEHKFDIIYSSAVFEHLAMPWVAATEIARLLKVGGILFVETHFSFAAHERPWHFFQFSDMALRALFSPALGFECLEAGMNNPMVGRFSSQASDYLKHRPVRGLYCHVEYLGRKVREIADFDWHDLDLNEVTGDTAYPLPQ